MPHNPSRGPRPGHDPSAVPAGGRFVTTTVEVEGREETKVVELPDFEPEPWGDDASLTIVGQRVPRVDAVEKVTGRARYTADIVRPRQVYAAIVRATIARGRVTRLDTAPALAIPGVLDAVSAPDLPRPIGAGGVKLFDTTVRYAGQPLAAVCADSETLAHRAARAVIVEYETEPCVVTFHDATAPGAPAIRGTPGNLVRGSPHIAERGDAERGLREADVVVTGEYRTPVALHTALEPHGALAEWDGDRLTVWESTQGIFRTRDQLATAFALPHTGVRVIKEYMGGGFGAKNGAGAHSYAAALLARRLGRPVRCVNDRGGEQTDTGNRPATVQRVSLGAARDGRLTAIVLEAEIPLGIGGWDGGPAAIYHEMYACPNVRTRETFAYVNAGAMSAFRAPGHCEGAFGLERAMDELARALAMDPLELRLRNVAERDQQKDRPYSANHLRECYALGAERFGWPTRRPRGGSDDASMLRRGYGVAAQVWGTGGGPPAYAIVKLESDGTATVLCGTQDLGTGARTVFAQIAAEALGARLADVRVIIGDTERTPYTGNSWGSMTTPSVGPAVRMAAEDARRSLLAAAAQIMGSEPRLLEARDSVVRVTGGGAELAFAKIADALGDVMILGRGTRGPNPEHTAIMTFGVQFAEVEVDIETGVVRVIRIVAAHDAGRIINPTLAESQLEGGILQGLGYALFEERVLDRSSGVVLNPTMHDYKIPTIRDTPFIDAFFVPSSDTVANHTGARGLAEPPIIPTAPAIANAVADALGAEVREIPLTPWRVLRARDAGRMTGTRDE